MDQIQRALAAKGYAFDLVGTWPEFRQALNATNYPLAVAVHLSGFIDDVPATAAALSAQLAAGRATWLVDQAELNPTLAAVFQGGYGGGREQYSML